MDRRWIAGLSWLFIAWSCQAQDGGKADRPTPEQARQEAARWSHTAAVSYTHLTLPTIYSV